MNEKRFLLRPFLLGLLAVSAVLVLSVVVLSPEKTASDDGLPPVSEAGNGNETVLSAEGELMQTFTYSRCEHRVTRRMTAPAELHGKSLKEVEALYPEWRITAFSPTLVTMEQRPEIFCPDHLVAMTGEGGRVCVFRNKYGDALALERELELSADQLPAALQEELAVGVGFATAEELEMWLESVES